MNACMLWARCWMRIPSTTEITTRYGGEGFVALLPDANQATAMRIEPLTS